MPEIDPSLQHVSAKPDEQGKIIFTVKGWGFGVNTETVHLELDLPNDDKISCDPALPSKSGLATSTNADWSYTCEFSGYLPAAGVIAGRIIVPSSIDNTLSSVTANVRYHAVIFEY